MTNEEVVTLLDTPYIHVYDLQYAEGKHYYNASRREKSHLICLKNEEAFREATPDAVTCFVIILVRGEEPKLLLNREYRYPTGQFLVSPPAGIIDPEDTAFPVPALSAARREIVEETGITLESSDTLSLVNPMVFSSPGMTDESNALACAVIRRDSKPEIFQTGAVGTELFDGYQLYSRAEAMKLVKDGRDGHGITYSLYTFAALMWFLSDLWE